MDYSYRKKITHFFQVCVIVCP